jgi:hypothetical protein
VYQSLDPARILVTLERLHGRIQKRFPESGLGKVCGELIDTGRTTAVEAAKLSAPNWPLRVGVGVIIALGLVALIAATRFLHLEEVETNLGLLQTLEAAVNLAILFGGAAWFLITLEERRKRQRALDALHQLRSLAHVVDMHQLTKDPKTLVDAADKERPLTADELRRYLDYCAEMLALIGKLAALYADRMRDGVVIDTVTEIENLTTSLARKIWQKIMVVADLEPEAST